MRSRLLLLWVSLLGATARADPVADALIAAVKLSDAPNYSWTTTVSDDAGRYYIRGRTERAGYTAVAMPAPEDLVVRLRLAGAVEIEAVFRGNQNCVINTVEGWRRPVELPPQPEFSRVGRDADASRTHATELEPTQRARIIVPPTTGGREIAERRPYRNHQLAICHPHEELGTIVSTHTEIAFADGVISGTLSENGAMLLLVHDGQTHITPRSASGTFKLWLSGSQITRYEIALRGRLSVLGRFGRKDVDVTQTMQTEIHSIGSTRVNVSNEAIARLRE